MITLVSALVFVGGVYAKPLAINSARLEPIPGLAELAQNGSNPALVQAALLLSGASSERSMLTLEALALPIALARELADSEPDAYTRGEAILELIHDAFFKRYVEQETRFDVAVLEGQYNCVSSSAVYLVLAREAGIEASGVVTKDHSFVSLTLPDGRRVDVETTNRNGYDPGTKKEFHDSFGKLTGYAYVPPSNYALRTNVSASHIIGLIAWNRATLLERAGDLGSALELAVDAYAFMANEEARAYLGDRAHNAAGSFLNARRWTEGIAFIQAVTERYGPLSDLAKLASQARIARLADAITAMDAHSALLELKKAEEEGTLPQDQRNQFIAAIYAKAADEARKTGGWLAAWKSAEQASLKEPSVPKLKEMERVLKSNWIAEVHNEFARLFNARRYEEALKVIERGLALLPENPTFAKDAAAAKKALGQ